MKLGGFALDVSLNYFCVRAVTRDRRVASDLLRESLKVLQQEDKGKTLSLVSCLDDQHALKAVLEPQGFTLSGNQFDLTL